MEAPMWKKTNLLQQLFIFFLILLEESLIVSSAGMGSGGLEIDHEIKFCPQMLSECRKNSVCRSTFRNVKKKCTSTSGSSCFAKKDVMRTCADDIDWLRLKQFGEKCQCDVRTFTIKKFKFCSEIYNMLYANPCYDHGVTVREENTIVTTTGATTGIYDVIRQTSNPTVSAEKFQSLSNQIKAEVEIKRTNHRLGIEPERDTDQAAFRDFEHSDLKRPEILRIFLAVNRDDISTKRGRGRPFSQPVNGGEIPSENSSANVQNYKEFQGGNKSKTLLQGAFSTSNIPAQSDRFLDNKNENVIRKFDPDAKEAAKVVAKNMSDDDEDYINKNATVHHVLTTLQQEINSSQPKENTNVEVYSQCKNNLTSLIVLAATSFFLGLFVVIIVVVLCYQSSKQGVHPKN